MGDESILKALKDIQSYIDVLYIANSYIQEDFFSQPILHRGCERVVLLGLKSCSKVASLIDGSRKGEGVDQLFEGLAEKKVIPSWLKDKLLEYMKLLNMEDEYCLCSPFDMYNSLPELIGILNNFKKYLLEFVV